MSGSMGQLDESDALHRRVQRFVAAWQERNGEGAARADEVACEDFEELALDIARYQATYSSGFRRLVEARGSSLTSIDEVPAVPTDAFRLTRVALHPAELDAVRFRTSGTTSAESGVHAMRTTATYRSIALAHASQALFAAWPGRKVVVAVAAPPSDTIMSSLSFMMQSFMEAFDGRSLSIEPDGAAFDARAHERWLLPARGLDLANLRRAGLIARERGEPLVVLATSFALVALLDTLRGSRLPTPRQTLVMQTGGFKGRSRHVASASLRKRVARAFGTTEEHIVTEYGMTELTSQLYEGMLANPEERDILNPPPWLRVTPVDPGSLLPVEPGATGLARFVDLGNVDSAVVVQTQDVIRAKRSGFELLGRYRGSPPRGCSLAYEPLLGSFSS